MTSQDDGSVSFVITPALSHPRDHGYAAGWHAQRMARAPGPFTTVERGLLVERAEALVSPQPGASSTMTEARFASLMQELDQALTDAGVPNWGVTRG